MDDHAYKAFIEFEKLGYGVAFERHLEELFIRLGYEVERTPTVGDFGADLILRREDERLLVQAKRWAQSVGVEAVQEAAAGRVHYSCDRALVITTSSFTTAARQLAETNGIELWDGRRYLDEAAGAVDSRVAAPRSPLERATRQFADRTDAVRDFYAAKEVDRYLKYDRKTQKRLFIDMLDAARSLRSEIGPLVAADVSAVFQPREHFELQQQGQTTLHFSSLDDLSRHYAARDASPKGLTVRFTTDQGAVNLGGLLERVTERLERLVIDRPKGSEGDYGFVALCDAVLQALATREQVHLADISPKAEMARLKSETVFAKNAARAWATKPRLSFWQLVGMEPTPQPAPTTTAQPGPLWQGGSDMSVRLEIARLYGELKVALAEWEAWATKPKPSFWSWLRDGVMSWWVRATGN